MNEAELAERCGKGDNLARKQLYERYAGQLMAICIRYIGDRETAQDVLHDGFLNIFRSFDKFTYKGEGSLKAWLARVMVNEALGYLRKQSSANQEIVVEELPDMVDGDDDTMEQIPQSVLMQFIKELPEGYRTVFNLYLRQAELLPRNRSKFLFHRTLEIIDNGIFILDRTVYNGKYGSVQRLLIQRR